MKIHSLLSLAIMISTTYVLAAPTIIVDELDALLKTTPAKNNDHGIADKIENILLKTNYASRFAFLPDSSPFKQACSKVNERKEVNHACVALSNILYCMRHPYRIDRPEECQTFCDNLFANTSSSTLFKETLLTLQNELLLDPKEVIDFMRAITKDAEDYKPSELCSENKINWNLNTTQKEQEDQEILYC